MDVVGRKWKEIKNFKKLIVDGRKILNCILQKGGGRRWTELVWLRTEASVSL